MKFRMWLIGLALSTFVLVGVGTLAHPWRTGSAPNDSTPQTAATAMPCMMGGGMRMPGQMGMRGPSDTMGLATGMMQPKSMMGPMGMMEHANAMPCAGVMAIPSLLDRHKEIRRGVTLTEKGVETFTESDNPRVVPLIQAHAEGMRKWLFEWGMPFRMSDPLFADLYAHRSDIKMTLTKTEKGVRAVLEGATPEAVKLVRALAAQMDRFVVKGWEKMDQTHPSPLNEAEGPLHPSPEPEEERP